MTNGVGYGCSFLAYGLIVVCLLDFLLQATDIIKSGLVFYPKDL